MLSGAKIENRTTPFYTTFIQKLVLLEAGLKGRGRYDISGLEEAKFEPGSTGGVLKNLLSIKRKREMDRIEAREHLRALEELVEIYDEKHKFTASDVCQIHKIWLGSIYSWAGKYRLINLSKGNFPFAPAREIPRLMNEFEEGPLREHTPCHFGSEGKTAEVLAVVHTELMLIHPFREGNGRVGRMLSVLMSLQAGLPPLDFRGILGKSRQEYFSAVQAGLSRNYRPMEEIFKSVIRKTLQTHA
jgi:cell filamentation protein